MVLFSKKKKNNLWSIFEAKTQKLFMSRKIFISTHCASVRLEAAVTDGMTWTRTSPWPQLHSTQPQDSAWCESWGNLRSALNQESLSLSDRWFAGTSRPEVLRDLIPRTRTASFTVETTRTKRVSRINGKVWRVYVCVGEWVWCGVEGLGPIFDEFCAVAQLVENSYSTHKNRQK